MQRILRSKPRARCLNLTPLCNPLEHTGIERDAGVAFLTLGGGSIGRLANGPFAFAVKRWQAMDGVARGAALVSAGSLTLVVMATVVKYLGTRLPAFEMLFFRSLIGFFFVLP